jgi:hypothetical protein
MVGAAASAALPQVDGGDEWPNVGWACGSLNRGWADVADDGWLNVTGSAEIARGFANGMTLFALAAAAAADTFAAGADSFVAGADIADSDPDAADICAAGMRGPVGAGGMIRGRGAGAGVFTATGFTDGEPPRARRASRSSTRVSTDVASPTS